MASDKTNMRQRRKSEKSAETVQEVAKNDTPAVDGDNTKQQKQ